MTDWNDLDAPTFFRLALRVAAYGGVISSHVHQQNEVDAQEKPIKSAAAMKAHPVLSNLIEWSNN